MRKVIIRENPRAKRAETPRAGPVFRTRNPNSPDRRVRKKRAQRRVKEMIPVCRTPVKIPWKSAVSGWKGREVTLGVPCDDVTAGVAVAGALAIPGAGVPVTAGVAVVVTSGVVVAADRVV
jgi:hypothetical protein